MELKDIKTFHQSENLGTKKTVHQMMPKFYDYIMAAELSVNPRTPQILVGNNKDSLYFHNKPNRRHSLSADFFGEDWRQVRHIPKFCCWDINH